MNGPVCAIRKVMGIPATYCGQEPQRRNNIIHIDKDSKTTCSSCLKEMQKKV